MAAGLTSNVVDLAEILIQVAKESIYQINLSVIFHSK